jgi:hypothetical protein
MVKAALIGNDAIQKSEIQADLVITRSNRPAPSLYLGKEMPWPQRPTTNPGDTSA